jgi:RND superfamily putative drug exporter
MVRKTHVQAAISALHGQVAATRGAIREPITAAYFGPAGPGQVLVISVPLAGDGTNGTSSSALDTLRDQALPATLGHVPGISYAVGGLTAGAAYGLMTWIFQDGHLAGRLGFTPYGGIVSWGVRRVQALRLHDGGGRAARRDRGARRAAARRAGAAW